MSKRSLEIFAEVCDRQSVSEAAKELGLTQPAVSYAIASLEKEYETELFVRRGRSLELSEPGRRLRQYADVILEQYERAWSSLHEEESSESYVIGVGGSAAETFLPSLIRKVPENISLSFISDDSERVMEMLREHQCDVAIADHNADESGMTYIPIYKEVFVFAASDSYTDEDSMGWNTLIDQKLLLEKKGSGSRAAVEAAVARRSTELKPYVESSSDFSLIRLAESGAGIAVLPLKLIEKSLKKKRLHTIKVKGTDLKRQYYMIYRSDMHMSEGFQQLLKRIQECAGKDK